MNQVLGMPYRQLGKSSIKASVITLGAWAIGGTMWGGSDDKEAINAIQKSIELGVTSIDTAPVYGFGKSEKLVAEAIKGMRDKVQLFTKYGFVWEGDEGEYAFNLTESGKNYRIYRNSRKKSVIRECEASLKRLNTDYIDLYQCHARDNRTPIEETMEAVEQLLREGKILAAGVSNYSVKEIEVASRVVPLASVQPPYSMILRDIEKNILPYCIKHTIGVIVYSPLQRGILTGKFKPDHQFKEGDHRALNKFFHPENILRINIFLEKIRPMAEAHQATMGQLVLNWTINQPGVTIALVGARNANQAEENAKAALLNISKQELDEITKLLNTLVLHNT